MTAKTSADIEEWRPVDGFPDYEVSSHGQVRRCVTNSRSHAGRILKPNLLRTGYLDVTLFKDTKPHKRLISRLVAFAFSGPPPSPLYEAAHDDGVKTNNHSDNIIWKTSAENIADKKRHGTYLCGQQCHKAKITEGDVAEIRSLYQPGSVTLLELGQRYGLGISAIHAIVKRISWRHVS